MILSSTIWTDDSRDSRWTEDQRKAIYTRGTDLLVAAAAGAGKTAVLVERAIQIVLDERRPVDIDRLLIVTFTRAAAGEMRQRINEVLVGALQKRPADPHLERQIFLLPRACIDTLHSFCGEVLRSHFYLLNLDPGFRVMEEAEAQMLRRDVLSAVIEEAYERCETLEPNRSFLYLARALSGRHGDERQLEDLVLRLYDYAYSLPRPRAWLKWMVRILFHAGDKPWEQQPWIGEWRDSVRLVLEDACEKIAIALRLAEGEGLKRYADILAQDQGTVKRLLALADAPYETIHEALEKEVDWQPLPRIRQAEGAAHAKTKDRIKSLRDKVKNEINDLRRNWFGRPASAVLQDLTLAAPLVQALTELVLSFDDAYRQAKSSRAVMDFADLEHYALAILAENAELSPWGKDVPVDPDAKMTPSPVALEYRDHFAEVLVDEYQDINGVQEAILELVTPPGRRFMVGDVKQSIYRFRRADPQVFLDRYERYSDLEDTMGDSMSGACRDRPRSRTVWGLRLDLTENFRSRPEVLETVNYLFGKLMTRRVGELDYDDRAYLRPRFEYPIIEPGRAGGRVEFHFLECRPSSGEDEGDGGGESEGEGEHVPDGGTDIEALDATRLEARWVAERVRRLVQDECRLIFDRSLSKYRTVTWRDVMVLMRSPRGRVSVFLEEFQRAGVPGIADGSSGYFATPEVETMLSLLHIIDNPRQDIPLAAVLRSPLVGLNASDLARIRLATRQGPFYCAVERAATGEAELESGLTERIREFWERLNAWRDLARVSPPAELLEEIYHETGYYNLVGGMPNGEGRQANLRLLVDRARQFAGTIYRGLFHFLRYIERMRDEGDDMDTARSLGENEDVVRILSVHRSKGLEFPIVVFSGLGCRFNLRDLSGDFLFHRRLGCGPRVYDLERGVIYPTVLHRLVKKRLKLEDLSEEMRLLYVALTRAREKLIVTGAVKDLWATVNKWRAVADETADDGPLSVAYSAEATSPLDWIGPILLKDCRTREVGNSPEALDAQTEFWELHLWPSRRLAGLREAEARCQKTGYSGEKKDYAGEKKDYGEENEYRDIAMDNVATSSCLTEEASCTIDAGELRARLFWTNPYQPLAGLPSKITVTEWRHRAEMMSEEEEEEGVRVGETVLFGREEYAGPGGARRGPEDNGSGHSPVHKGRGPGNEKTGDLHDFASDSTNDPKNDSTNIPKNETAFLPKNGTALLLEDLPPGFELPSFIEGKRHTGAERGRAVHLVMAKIDLKEPVDAARVRHKIRDLVERGILSPDQADLIRVGEIVRFFRTKLGRRVIRAAQQDTLWREMPFTAGFAVSELYPGLLKCTDESKCTDEGDDLFIAQNTPIVTAQNTSVVTTSPKQADERAHESKVHESKLNEDGVYKLDVGDRGERIEKIGKQYEGEIIVVQGVIDCLLVSDDGITLIDYKTDRVSAEDISAVIEKYRVQLQLYSRAVERILCRPVTEKYLYFFSLGREIALE
ncbi:MAG TPA: helicase-exonuclease AddAB subunit AddA [Clostridia bacterium]|nr:helicase-exonuclease AddAB subunit AddA [Clostridia bacterium]